MLWMIPYILVYLFTGFIIMGCFMKATGETIESLKKDLESVFAIIITWPTTLVMLAIFGLWIVMKWVGIWSFEHIFRLPSEEKTQQISVLLVSRQPHSKSDPVEKVIEETTGSFDFIDME